MGFLEKLKNLKFKKLVTDFDPSSYAAKREKYEGVSDETLLRKQLRTVSGRDANLTNAGGAIGALFTTCGLSTLYHGPIAYHHTRKFAKNIYKNRLLNDEIEDRNESRRSTGQEMLVPKKRNVLRALDDNVRGVVVGALGTQAWSDATQYYNSVVHPLPCSPPGYYPIVGRN